MLVPRNRFGSSVYNVPLLLALRFFYHASPFEAIGSQIHHGPGIEARSAAQQTVPSISLISIEPPTAPLKISRTTPSIFSRFSKMSTVEFLALLNSMAPSLADHRVVSLTWTKALGSPLSHESIQFIVEERRNGHRDRVVTDRHVEDGDSVIVGFDWTAGEEPSQHHDLPLPLLSLEFAHGPGLYEFAKLLVEVTDRKPKYSLLREMCWWYAEAIFETTHSRYGGTVKPWEFSHLRYSFVVRTNVIKREKLVRHAEAFRKMNIETMKY